MPDSRFSALSSDPRYRIPNRKKSRTAIDSRFKGIFSDQDFRKKASVDRYGRKIQAEKGKKELEERFQLEEDEDDDAPELAKSSSRKIANELDEADSEEDDDEEEEEEEEGRASTLVKRDPARQGGFADQSSSEEESSEEEEDESEAEIELAELTAGQEQDEEIPMGDVTRRIAAVNLDWDNIRAADIMAVSSSFVPTGGKVQRVTIYPSQFGKERLQREELEGPPKEIFSVGKKKKSDDDEEEEEDSEDEEARIKKQLLDEQTGEGDEFDTAKLRQYQLERLRYYYAVIECDSERTAKALYDSMDGREYLSTANFFDLRFVPDETSFEEDEPHEECDSLALGYRPNEFKTEALTHSKVRLTWDDDDATRKEVQKRAFSRAEMEEEDLKAYIGSDSSDAESISSKISSAENRKTKKRDAQREKMRAALGLASEPAPRSSSSKKKDPAEAVGDMQITFTSGLGGGGSKEGKSVFENEPQDEESTRARYIRKERERKQRRKDKNKSSNGEAAGDEPAPEDNNDKEEADPFNDPFFNDPGAASKAASSAAKKASKARLHAENAEKATETAHRAADLALLMASENAGNGDELRHFDMREIKKAEKDAKRSKINKKYNKKKSQDPTAEENVNDDFTVETEDPRFKKLFESHEYAIDPSDRLFAGTRAMKEAVEEGRRKRRRMGGGDGGGGEEGGEVEEREERKGGKKVRRARV